MVAYEWCIICKEVGAMYVMIGTIHAGLGLVSARLSGLWLQLSDIPMGMGVHLPVSAMVVWDRSNRRNSAYRDRFAERLEHTRVGSASGWNYVIGLKIWDVGVIWRKLDNLEQEDRRFLGERDLETRRNLHSHTLI